MVKITQEGGKSFLIQRVAIIGIDLLYRLEKKYKMEEKIREIFELIEQIGNNNNFLNEITDDVLIKKIEKIKFEYFKKGYSMCLAMEKQERKWLLLFMKIIINNSNNFT